MITVHGVDPDYTREGGSIPVVLTLADTTGKDCILIPMGRSDDGAHSQNEKLNISNFKNGVRNYCGRAGSLQYLCLCNPCRKFTISVYDKGDGRVFVFCLS